MDWTNAYVLAGLGLLAGLILVGIFFWLKRKTTPSSVNQATVFQSQKSFASPLKQLFLRSQPFEKLITQLEEILLTADVGVAATEQILKELEERSKDKNQKQKELFELLKEILIKRLTPQSSFQLDGQKPQVIFFVGVNGVGKTTSIGKLLFHFQKQNLKPLVVAADTFRAAAADQLKIWAKRANADFFEGEPQADPASVVHGGLEKAIATKADIVLVDTAGRLNTKLNLMQQLSKMVRVTQKVLGRKPQETWLVLDSTVGQNGIEQVRDFLEHAKLSGLILTKFDGSSKGGVLLAATQQTGLPIRFLGTGEKIEDLSPFDPKVFVEKLLGSPDLD